LKPADEGELSREFYRRRAARFLPFVLVVFSVLSRHPVRRAPASTTSLACGRGMRVIPILPPAPGIGRKTSGNSRTKSALLLQREHRVTVALALRREGSEDPASHARVGTPICEPSSAPSWLRAIRRRYSYQGLERNKRSPVPRSRSCPRTLRSRGRGAVRVGAFRHWTSASGVRNSAPHA